ncbi:MAG: NAD-dependent epimerase/dehydratase family protein, partial [Synergistaceae bacterium]|nr:NAD-dependent epimerase/dehydratase family protein [Synergistaceae bacterium]MBQ7170281.1 NAD-dependent epimerase/dehydratase family protein [Synergistaceae bacterium]
MSHNILILGGTGAMGAPLADILAEKGLSVHVTTRQNRPSRPGITYIKGSAKDTGFIRGVLAQSE